MSHALCGGSDVALIGFMVAAAVSIVNSRAAIDVRTPAIQRSSIRSRSPWKGQAALQTDGHAVTRRGRTHSRADASADHGQRIELIPRAQSDEVLGLAAVAIRFAVNVHQCDPVVRDRLRIANPNAVAVPPLGRSLVVVVEPERIYADPTWDVVAAERAQRLSRDEANLALDAAPLLSERRPP